MRKMFTPVSKARKIYNPLKERTEPFRFFSRIEKKQILKSLKLKEVLSVTPKARELFERLKTKIRLELGLNPKINLKVFKEDSGQSKIFGYFTQIEGDTGYYQITGTSTRFDMKSEIDRILKLDK
ncbi:MAG: hypothetical protein NUV57_05685 [archaeon]|nr:hypothetical protein [archaeon]